MNFQGKPREKFNKSTNLRYPVFTLNRTGAIVNKTRTFFSGLAFFENCDILLALSNEEC